jgi:hypothetical protein
MDEIQRLRKEIIDIFDNQIRPKRERLDELLNIEAEKICPFSKGEIIILDNGKKGVIKEITYHSLNFESLNQENNFIANDLNVDKIDYIYTYSIDNNKISITWNISGIRLNKDNNPGKNRFVDINPVNFIIDEKNKSVKHKDLNDYMGKEHISNFDSIKFMNTIQK